MPLHGAYMNPLGTPACRPEPSDATFEVAVAVLAALRRAKLDALEAASAYASSQAQQHKRQRLREHQPQAAAGAGAEHHALAAAMLRGAMGGAAHSQAGAAAAVAAWAAEQLQQSGAGHINQAGVSEAFSMVDIWTRVMGNAHLATDSATAGADEAGQLGGLQLQAGAAEASSGSSAASPEAGCQGPAGLFRQDSASSNSSANTGWGAARSESDGVYEGRGKGRRAGAGGRGGMSRFGAEHHQVSMSHGFLDIMHACITVAKLPVGFSTARGLLVLPCIGQFTHEWRPSATSAPTGAAHSASRPRCRKLHLMASQPHPPVMAADCACHGMCADCSQPLRQCQVLKLPAQGLAAPQRQAL